MEQVAKHIAKKASELELLGGSVKSSKFKQTYSQFRRRPDTIAGAAIFLASQASAEKRTAERKHYEVI